MIKNNMQDKSIRFLIVFIFILASFNTINAQPDISYISSRLQLAYKHQSYLKFDIKYTYALESTPTTIIDSMNGIFKISGSYYWGTLDSAEFMQNNSYAVILYKPDKVMILSNPSPVYPQIANFAVFDSLIGKHNYTTSFGSSGANKTITLNITDTDFPYKNFKVTYDSTTFFVKQLQYTVREDYEGNNDIYKYSAAGNTSPYVIIKADYSNYSTTSFSNTVFLTNNYFVLSGNTYTPQSPYNYYEVFLASPNLIQ